MSGGPLPWTLPQVLPGDDSETGTPLPEVAVCAEGLALLIRQYADSPNLQALICVLLDRVQELEDASADVHNRVLDIENAEGANLELLGRIVREPKKGRPDYRYRSAIRARIRSNRSQGRAEDLIAIAALVDEIESETGAQILIQDVQPGTVELRVERTKINAPHDVDGLIRHGKAAGIRLHTILVPYPFDRTRLLKLTRAADYDSTNALTGLGWTADATRGGTLAHVLA